MQKPLISIIIPTFNRAHLILETINSIKDQSYSHWECVIVDDHSTDNTFHIVSEISKNDSRIQIYKRPNDKPKGPSSCRNFGFEKSKGAFVNFFDSDDLMLPNKLEVDLRNITSGNFDFTISQSCFFDNSTKEVLGFWNNKLYSDNPINDFIVKNIGWGVNTPLWKKESLLKNNLLFDEGLITADDYFYHIQALEYGFKPHINNAILVKQRVHTDRLENFNVKSTFKTIVNYYLLKNHKKLSLDLTTIIFLKKNTLNQLGNLYKHKKWKSAVKISLKLIRLPKENNDYKKIISLFIKGTFFKVTSMGYKYFN